MSGVIGLDVGGVNTKAAWLEGAGGEGGRTANRRFEVWRDRDALEAVIRGVVDDLDAPPADAAALTMTAELSDAFRTKREGVAFVLDAAERALGPVALRVFTTRGELIDPGTARQRPLDVAASNWVATAQWAARAHDEALLVDVGSTTADVVPILGGEVAATGWTDLDRLLTGELVYTGALRTNLAGIAPRVPVRGGWCPVAPELFAISADVHVVLGHLAPPNAWARVSRRGPRSSPRAPGCSSCARSPRASAAIWSASPAVGTRRPSRSRPPSRSPSCSCARWARRDHGGQVGGALARDRGGRALRALCAVIGDAAARHPLLVVPGGGRFADAVREEDARHGLAAATHHRMAILAMDQFGLMLADLVPGAGACENLDAAAALARDGRAAVLLPAALVLAASDLPASWDVTSDSIAAWVAGRARARRVVLLKSVPGLYAGPPAGEPIAGLTASRLAALQREGHASGVDAHFAVALAAAGVEAWVIGGRDPSRLVELLDTGATTGTRLTPGGDAGSRLGVAPLPQ
jgi:aspartokinase-like uncharacterized kinase